MANDLQELATYKRKEPFSSAIHTFKKNGRPLVALWIKFNNDWSWNNAAGLAYNLLLAIFPIVIALISLLGLFLGTLAPGVFHDDINKLTVTFSTLSEAKPFVVAAFTQVKREAGVLGVIAAILAVFNGSRLFIFMEGCLDIIYHVRPRNILAQNVMSILMLLLFVVLLPLAALASAGPAFVFSLLKKTPLDQIPGVPFVLGFGGVLSGLMLGYILFQVIYMVVPNQKISFRKSWLGAIVAAVLLELYLVLFPLYVAQFLGAFAGALGVLILLIFFYYFALILFVGAQVNAFFLQGIRVTQHDLVTMVYTMSSHLATNEEAVKEQASSSPRGEVPKDSRPQYEVDREVGPLPAKPQN